MYCSNCGNIIIGKGLECTNCGSSLHLKENLRTNTVVIDEDVTAVKIDISSNNIFLKNKENSSESITVREREKRIIVERLQKEIETARQSHRQSQKKNVHLADTGQPFETARIIGERTITGSPAEVAKKKKISGTKKFLITTGTFVTGLGVFFVCMGFLFWRFAPASDNYKQKFVQWMSTNANDNVNDFIFNDMQLKKYYAPEKIVDYSGTYIGRSHSAVDTIFATFRDGKLTGTYHQNGTEHQLNGFIGSKGDFIFVETMEGKQIATVTGHLFDVGYLTAERNDMNGRKEIWSLDKLKK